MTLRGDPADPEVRYSADDAPGHWYRGVFDIAFAVARHDFGFARCDAEDVAQEMTVRAYLAMREKPINHSWIRRGSIYLCIDLTRTRRAQQRALLSFAESLSLRSAEPPEVMRDVAFAVAKLRPAHRELIRQRFEEGRTLDEIDTHLQRRRRGEYELRKCVAALRGMLTGDR